MNDRDFLLFIAARLVNVYGESELTDFVQRLKSIALTTPSTQRTQIGDEDVTEHKEI